MMRSLTLLAALPLALALGLAGAASAQTPDGATPAVEDICTKWGLTGQVNGLCKAYCEAMDCDDASPQASPQACERVLGKITTALGDTPFPTCQDSDDDGVPNGLDNCPNVANPDQADANPGTPEGDACEPVDELCPLLGSSGVPATTAALIADAEALSPPGTLAPAESACEDIAYIAAHNADPNGQSVWVFEVNPEALSGALVASSFIVVDESTGETTLRYSNIISLLDATPEEFAACQAVLDAVKAADPFGVCAP